MPVEFHRLTASKVLGVFFLDSDLCQLMPHFTQSSRPGRINLNATLSQGIYSERLLHVWIKMTALRKYNIFKWKAFDGHRVSLKMRPDFPEGNSWDKVVRWDLLVHMAKRHHVLHIYSCFVMARPDHPPPCNSRFGLSGLGNNVGNLRNKHAESP